MRSVYSRGSSLFLPRRSTFSLTSYLSRLDPVVVCKASSMSVSDRAKAAVLGGLVADAASLGLHWIYDQEALVAALESKGSLAEPEFFPPMNKYYTHEDGDFTPYGHELFAILKSLAEQCGQVDGGALAKDLASYYKDQAASNHYLNKSSKAVLENVSAGKTFPDTALASDAQANAFVKAPAILALKAGRLDLVASLQTAITVQQSDEAAVSAGLAAGLILDKVIQGHSIKDALTWALDNDSPISSSTRDHLRIAMGHSGEPYSVAAKTLGLSCGLPSSLQCSILSAVGAPSFVEGVRTNIVAGGDNASRNILVGALLAAQYGLEAVPLSWKNKTKLYRAAESLVDSIIANRE